MKSETSKGAIISFLGIQPPPGMYCTSNRHDCSGRAQISITIREDGTVTTFCPTCGDSPVVFYEMGSFNYFGGKIIA